MGDRYLQLLSFGGFSADSKMIMFNTAQWTGNYNTAGVNRITAQMANFGTTILYMRIAFRSSTGNLFGSSTAAMLPADGVWRAVTFDLTESGMTNISGTQTMAEALNSISEMRILSAIGGPAFNGDTMAGALGLDNLRAEVIPITVPVITEFVFVSGQPRVSFTTVSGRSYRVDYKNNITDANWSTVMNAGSVAGTGGTVQVTDPDPAIPTLPSRMYRVVLLP